MRRALVRGIGALTALLLTAVSFAQNPLLWGSLKPGRFRVGFRTEVRFDVARQYDAEYVTDAENPPARRPRPILLAIWYPTEKRGPAMDYEAYLRLPGAAVSKGFRDRLVQFMPEMVALDTCGKLPKDLAPDETAAIGRLMSARDYAVANAPIASGRFPVVIYHPGLGGTYEENSVLFEYLVSHGYIVISSAFQMAQSTTMSIDWDLDRSLRDLDFLARATTDIVGADPGRLAVMGHSYGGQAAAAWAAAPVNSVAALVTLDSGLEEEALSSPGFAKLKAYLQPNRLNVRCPAFRFARQEAEPNFDYFRPNLKFGGSYEATVGSMTHNDFLTHGAIRPMLLPSQWPDAAKARAVRRGYDRVCTHILAFLDVALKQSRDAKAALERSENGVGLDGDFAFRFRPPVPAPPNARQLSEMIRKGGTNRALEFLRVSKEDVDLGSDGIRGASRLLVAAGEPTRALELVQGCTEIFPDSTSVFVELGELLAKAGENRKAIAAYLRARDCLPNDKSDAGWKEWWAKDLPRRLAELGWHDVPAQGLHPGL